MNILMYWTGHKWKEIFEFRNNQDCQSAVNAVLEISTAVIDCFGTV